MNQGLSADHFFENDASIARRARQAEKSSNKNGNPITLKSKPLAAIQDPNSPCSLLMAESSGSVRRVNMRTRKIQDVYTGPTAPVTCVAVGGPGNHTIFAGSWDKSIWTWNVLQPKCPDAKKLTAHTDFVKALVCAKLGSTDVLISGGADARIIVWDVVAGSRLHVLQDVDGGMMAVQDLAVDPVASGPKEVVLVSASSDPFIRRWRIRLEGWEQVTEVIPGASGETSSAIAVHETTVYRLFFDTDGDEVDLWTASGDGTAKCLARSDDATGQFSVEETIQHGDHVRAVVVTDRWIITAGRDEDIKIWDRVTGMLYCVLDGHYDEVTVLAVVRSPESEREKEKEQLVSVGLDGTIRTWPLEKSELDRLVEERTAGVAGKGEGPNGDEGVGKRKNVMSAEEEAELAALLEEV